MSGLSEILQGFERTAVRVLVTREKRWRVAAAPYFQRAAISALMVRQYRLYLYFLRGPAYWDMLVGHSLLRMMIETLIVTKWICVDLDARCTMYVNHGLGQARLFGENLRKLVDEEGDDDGTISQMADAQFAWVEGQKMLQFVDINLGNWADIDLRKMAHEVGCDDIYKFGYLVFSASVHGAWNHTGMTDVRPCQNSLHKYHLIGAPERTIVSEDFLYRACKYFDLYFDCIDGQLGNCTKRPSLRGRFDKQLPLIFDEMKQLFDCGREGMPKKGP